MTTPAFPIVTVADSRFTFGLLLDLTRVLEQHGYPPVVAGADLVRLQESLFNFLYTKPESTDAEGVQR
ncbi:hypothetical protein [Catenuloplanes indicus]|uniref:Uncharacterized protein n=1 Tax=Catenuloplanes indicus TaxID=137267 RepID=A0AAE4AYQ0_9ACTN|nr:hypothetical protein [Catenuloplanes indicus]MDQ0367519.1 hypothetical protein [Catenuloplanes indicus]